MTLTIDASPIATAGPNGDVCVGDIYSLSSATATNQVSVLWTHLQEMVHLQMRLQLIP